MEIIEPPSGTINPKRPKSQYDMRKKDSNTIEPVENDGTDIAPEDDEPNPLVADDNEIEKASLGSIYFKKNFKSNQFNANKDQ